MEKNVGVFVCSHVCDDGLPILCVFHDGEGDWQFMCVMMTCPSCSAWVMGDVVLGDASLNELADLGCNHSAERAAVDADWSIVDGGEETIRANIAEHGWHIAIVSEGNDEPGFAYSIGMKKTLGHPEIVVFGLPGQLMASVSWVFHGGQALGSEASEMPSLLARSAKVRTFGSCLCWGRQKNLKWEVPSLLVTTRVAESEQCF